MSASTSLQCQKLVDALKAITLVSDAQNGSVPAQAKDLGALVQDQMDRLSLWAGNIGAFNQKDSPLSLESRLRNDNDILAHVQRLLEDMVEVSGELLDLASLQGQEPTLTLDGLVLNKGEEESELIADIEDGITRLFKVSSLIRRAAPTDPFTKSLTRRRYEYTEQPDIAHVGEKFPKLATEELQWLQRRLGRAITKRRHYLRYIRDHRAKLEGQRETLPKEQRGPDPLVTLALAYAPSEFQSAPDSANKPSTTITKASTIEPGKINAGLLQAEEQPDSDDDAKSYTTMARSVDNGTPSSITHRIPRLNTLPEGPNNQVECPFCYRFKRFKNEKFWIRHVFSDLRSYVCTSPDCDDLYFTDLNQWFRHEMETHRVTYTCRVCQGRSFDNKADYLAHIKRRHTEMMQYGGEGLVLNLAKKPMEEIAVMDCPCCSDWIHRVKERSGIAPDIPDDTVVVPPPVFKRHLASHLEQLALFAIPVSSGGDVSDDDSNAAIASDIEGRSFASDLPSFGSDAQHGGSDASSSGGEEPETQTDDSNEAQAIPVPDDVLMSMVSSEKPDHDAFERLINHKRYKCDITERVVRASAQNVNNPRYFRLLIQYSKEHPLPLTGGTTTAAIVNPEFAAQHLLVLLDTIPGFFVDEVAMATALETCYTLPADEQKRLLWLMMRRVSRLTVTKRMLKAAVANPYSGPNLTRQILETPSGQRLVVTTDIVEAAVGNKDLGGAVLHRLLQHGKLDFKVTERIMMAAIENDSWGGTLVTLLANHMDDDFVLTPKMFQAAIENDDLGLYVMHGILDRLEGPFRIDDDVVGAACRKGHDTLDALKELTESPKVHLIVTERTIEVAASLMKRPASAISFFLGGAESSVLITLNAIISAATNEDCGMSLVKHLLFDADNDIANNENRRSGKSRDENLRVAVSTLLRSSDRTVDRAIRTAVLFAIAEAERSTGFEEEIMSCLNYYDGGVKQASMRALDAMPTIPERIQEAVAEYLNYGDTFVQRQAIVLLGHRLDTSDAVLDQVATMLYSSNSYTRRFVIGPLLERAQEADRKMASMASRMDSVEQEVRIGVIRELWAFRPFTRKLMEAVVRAGDDEVQDISQDAQECMRIAKDIVTVALVMIEARLDELARLMEEPDHASAYKNYLCRELVSALWKMLEGSPIRLDATEGTIAELRTRSSVMMVNSEYLHDRFEVLVTDS